MKKIRIAIIGVGNCAKSLAEGISYYTQNPNSKVGLIHPSLFGYSVADIEIVAAFDIDKRKVNKPLKEAACAEPNRTLPLNDIIVGDAVVVRMGYVGDSTTKESGYFIQVSDEPTVDIKAELKNKEVDIVLNYLPTGSDEAAFYYANEALEAGCSFINCMPTKLGRDDSWIKKFEDKGLVLLGDDIKSQLGATVLNRSLLELFKMRGLTITQSDQTNYGGNADHHNLHFRPHAKEASKESALHSVVDEDDFKPVARMVYTEKNYDHKRASLFIVGNMFGGSQASVHVILDDEDSPNSGGMVVDAIRTAFYFITNKRAVEAKEYCSSFMKAPFVYYSESDSYKKLQELNKDV